MTFHPVMASAAHHAIPARWIATAFGLAMTTPVIASEVRRSSSARWIATAFGFAMTTPVIASEAKQSSLTLLDCLGTPCFAMTPSRKYRLSRSSK